MEYPSQSCMMKTKNWIVLKILSFVGLIFSAFPIIILGLWIHSFNHGTTQAERVSLFDNYFPESLRGRFDTAYLSIAFCILSMISAIVSLRLPGKIWKVMNIIVLCLSGVLFFLNLFSMM